MINTSKEDLPERKKMSEKGNTKIQYKQGIIERTNINMHNTGVANETACRFCLEEV